MGVTVGWWLQSGAVASLELERAGLERVHDALMEAEAASEERRAQEEVCQNPRQRAEAELEEVSA